MEYPCQAYMTRGVLERVRAETLFPEYLELVVVHEVAHQWWSQLVGDDCIDWGFLDEGLTCWSHNYYGEVYYSDWEYFQYYRYLDTVRMHHEEFGIGSVINQSNYERPDLVGYIDYTKAPLILEKLRVELGHEKFVASLSHFFKQNYFDIATLPGLQEAFEFVCGEDMDWFFLPWFDNPFLPDYSFTSVVYNWTDDTLTVSIEDLNENTNPYSYSQRVQVRVNSPYGATPIDDTVWINSTTTFVLFVPTRPTKVSLLYNDYTLVDLVSNDIDSLNTQSIRFVGTPSLAEFWGSIPIEFVVAFAVTGVLWVLAFYVFRKRSLRDAA
jgi:aminopeptidase N